MIGYSSGRPQKPFPRPALRCAGLWGSVRRIVFACSSSEGRPAFASIMARLFPFGSVLCFFLAGLTALAGSSLGLRTEIVTDQPGSANFPLVAGGSAAPLWYSPDDHAGVIRAIGDLRADVDRVSGLMPALSTAAAGFPPAGRPVIIGTVGHSALIDGLVAADKFDASDLMGKWESFVISVVTQPLPGVDQALVIAGSDKRGTIYGLYELSEQIGVSPWYWWADVPARTSSSLHIVPGRFASGEPAVKYRGIFLNDEAPALTGWTNARFGDRNGAFYAKVFELLLRLRGNYLWPAMWGDAFNEDDPGNPRLADEYGVVMGTSHHEPMMRAQQEWARHKSAYGNAQWNYATNAEGLRAFWRDGIVRNKDYENLVTVGMRGDGDEPMIVGGDIAENAALLQAIMDDQRAILAAETGRPAAAIPQLWALYKEVQDYYDRGLRPPEDVTLLWCDDNWGNIRRLPSTAEERNRAGGSGVYYHFDYVGGPRSYKWLNTNPLPKIQEQMNLAWQTGADRIWIVNVGDLKPMEVPIEFFLRMAWDPAHWTAERCDDFLLDWAAREFGSVHSAEVAALVGGYTKLNGLRKPELLAPSTYSLLHYREAERVLSQWRDLAARAQALHLALPVAARDAFYQLVVHPILACANLNDLYVVAARNAAYAGQSRASTNASAGRVSTLFQADADLTAYWNDGFAGGKWIHLMDQVHIGYTTWSDPPFNTMPSVLSYAAPATSDLGVALEGSATALAHGATGVLPLLHSEGGAGSRYLEVFRRGTLDAYYSVTANQPWVTITPASGILGDDVRVDVSLDWARVPIGSGEVQLSIRGGSSPASRTVRLPFVKAAPAPATQPEGFLDPEGFVAIEAPHYDREVSADGVGWQILPDHGRGVGGVTPVPVTAPSVVSPGENSPRLEYDVYLRRRGELAVRVVVSPTMNYIPGQALRCAISLDDQAPQLIAVGADYESAVWTDSVRDSVRAVSAAVIADTVGHHVFKFWMVDPGVVLQRLEIDTGGLKPSYLGPSESPRGRRVAVAGGGASTGSASVVIEAEAGTLGAEFPAFAGSVPAYVSVSATNASGSPGSSARVARYQVTFPAAGAYRLFARVRVGPAVADDDSFYVGNGFGAKNPATNSDWRALNGLGGVGFAALSDIVQATGGTAGAGIWKWIDVTGIAGVSFNVPSAALVQTMDIGGRENGFDIDKLVFGPAANTVTVDDLMQGSGGTAPSPSVHVFEAEAGQYGAELLRTSGTPAYLTVSTANASLPGTAARVVRFSVNFSAAGSYRLFARVRIGAGGAGDDSLFVGSGFGAKDPALAADWRTANNFAFSGYADSGDVVEASNGGTAGTGVWKWIDLSAIAGATFTVPTGSLAQTFDLGGREDGLAIDKIVFAPAGRVYTVALLDAGALGAAASPAPVFTAALEEPRQIIDGFGASSAWNPTPFTDAQTDLFFSPTSGIGLSLLRIRIAPDGTTVETGTAKKAVARGVKVWATPWSPPAAWKSNNDVNNGGTLLPERRADWAARLADFAVNMQVAGVPLLAISAQNEPDYTATWESCIWTPAELAAFVRDHLGPALVSRGVATRVLAAEPIGWTSLAAYGDALLGDANARPYVSQIATHQYSGSPFAYAALVAQGKPLWMTEYSDSGADSDPGMDSALRVASTIHDFLAVAEGNAWHYWWLTQGNSTGSTGALTEFGALAKRGWALGNWSRFVRPGFRRINLYGSGETVRATAFVAPASRRLAIVAVNSDSSERVVPLALSGGGVLSLTPWETSEARSLAALAPISPAEDGSFSLPLPARSITTFLGDSLNRPPASLVLSGSMVRENLPAGTVVGALSATDFDPGETFTFTLVAGAGDAANAAFAVVGNQLRTAAELDHEKGVVRSVRIRVNDSLGASFEQSFAIVLQDDPQEYADWSAPLPAGQNLPELDPDGDGFANLLAFALGGAPGQVLASGRHPRFASEDGNLFFEFPVPDPAPADLSWMIERSADLVTWTELAAKEGAASWTGLAPVETAAGGGGTNVVRVRADLAGGRAFYRLRVVLNGSAAI